METPSQLPRIQLREALRNKAQEEGFQWFGVASAAALEVELERFRQWLQEGRHAAMAWLQRDPERRCDPAQVLEGCRTVIALGINYQVHTECAPAETAATGRVSRYATGRDYHRVLEKPLRRLAHFLNAHGPEGTRSKSYVDHGPLLERTWAARAGLGFQGKHTLLINPQEGSWFFLAVLLTTAELPPTQPEPNTRWGCGDCRRCIDACPTGAITDPWQLDARLCLSYLTIEHRGPVPPDLWPHYAGNVFGCDICQEVCPYNRKRATPSDTDSFAPRLVPREWSLLDLLRIDETRLEGELRQSPLRRPGVEGLLRNGAIVASERGGAPEAAELDRIASDPSRPDWLRDTARQAADRIHARLASEGGCEENG